MNRRKAVTAALASVAGLTAQSKKSADDAIQLHVDMSVDPAKEKDLKKNYPAQRQKAMSYQFKQIRLVKP